jgi:hypothetical protein
MINIFRTVNLSLNICYKELRSNIFSHTKMIVIYRKNHRKQKGQFTEDEAVIIYYTPINLQFVTLMHYHSFQSNSMHNFYFHTTFFLMYLIQLTILS